MLTFVNQLVIHVHATAFEITLHIISWFISSIFLVLYDEQVSPFGPFDPSTALWYVFLPLWCANAMAAYFNLLVFARRVLFYKTFFLWLRTNRRPWTRSYRPQWMRYLGSLLYALLCNLTLFLFTHLLYHKLTDTRTTTAPTRHASQSDGSNYSMEFLPLICFANLILLVMLINLCNRCCS